MANKYQCPGCHTDEAQDIMASQAVWANMSVAEYADGTHHLVDAKLSGDWIGEVDLECLVCERQWSSPELTT